MNGQASVSVEKRTPGTWALGVSFFVEGKRVRWLAPTTVERGSEAFTYEVSSPAHVFNKSTAERAKRYARFERVLWMLSTLTLFGVLALYARRGIGFMRESSAGPIGTGMLLGMLGLGIAWLVRLPFRLVEHWWDRRYGVDELDYVTWLFADWSTLTAEFLSVCFALLVVMALGRRLGERWWLPGAATFVGVAALFSFVFPYLDFGSQPLREEPLVAAADRYRHQLGLPDIPIRVIDPGDTKDVNAYAAGFGPSRRVVLWATLLPFPLGEQEVVVAHELGHHAARHLLKGLAWFALFAIPGAWIIMRVTRRRGGMGAPEAVPLALLVAALVQLAASPAQNWISRRMEAEADWKALQVTRDPGSLERLMIDLQSTSLEDPSPPTWDFVLRSTHPSLAQRVAMARAWALRDR